MTFKKVAKKFLSVLLAGTLVMSTGAPVSVSAGETPDGITEVSVADVLSQDTAGLPADLNDIVSVDTQNCVIDLNGASVVVVQAEGQGSTYSQIFPDYDGDKLPDSRTPLEIEGQPYYKLYRYELRGYSDPTKPFEGDISITLSGGNIKNVYGIYGTENAPVSVNGDVKLYLEGVNASGGNAITSYYGKAENVTFSYTSTMIDNARMYAACESQIAGNVDFVFGKRAQLRGTAEATHGMIGVATGSTIGGDVNAGMEFESSSYGFLNFNTRYYYTDFLGITDTEITGSVNYDLKGVWNPAGSTFLQSSTVGKDVNIHISSANFNQMAGTNETVMVMDSTVSGNLNFTGDAETGVVSRGYIYLLRGTSADKKSTVKGNLYVDIPLENIGNAWKGIGDNAAIEGSVYSNVAGSVAIDTVGPAVYTISEDVKWKELAIYEDANVVIAEGVSVELSRDLDLQTGAKLVNNGSLSLKLANRSGANGSVAGTLENKGSLDVEYSSDEIRGHLIIDATGLIINEKDATWNVGCYIDNQGKIVNYGSFVQSYSHEYGGEYYYAKLGKIYTTMPLTLSREINKSMYTHIYNSTNKTYNSEIYYVIDVDYPSDCAAIPSLTGTQIVSSGISEDRNKYIRVARVGDGVISDFTLTPGAVKNENYVLKKVTYGAENSQIEATKTAGGEVYTASVLGEFSPITITLEYGEGTKITPISLDKSSDSVNGLAVDRTYTQASPLYDLGSLTIIGDVASEEGSVVYSHVSGQLPKGIVFQDGKLYGTCKEASDTETVLTFTVTGRNQTTADFTLTLGPVAKAEPSVTAPTGLSAVYGQTFADVTLPSDENGRFTWDTGHHALSDKVGDAGEHTCYVTYWPTSENYTEKRGIMVTVIVNPATPVYEETLSEIETLCDTQLGDISLPDTDGGRYRWVSATSVKPKDQERYSVIYLPDDIVNYDWTRMDGWNNDRKGVVFSVRIKVVHAWDEGAITLEPTKETEGEKVYTCGLCGVTRTEVLDKLPDDSTKGDTSVSDNNTGEDTGVSDNNTGGNVSTDGGDNTGSGNGNGSGNGSESGSATGGGSDAGQEPVQPKVGYTLSDKKSKAVYKVSVAGKEVTYVKPLKKTYNKVGIPNTIKYDGVTYKVTAIANNAFKNNKKLKSVTIPKNISRIGSKAFYGCKKLTKLTIGTTKLTEKKVGKQAFTKMGSSNYRKVTVKVPKKKYRAYKKMLLKRGLSKKAKVKK